MCTSVSGVVFMFGGFVHVVTCRCGLFILIGEEYWFLFGEYS